MNKKEKQIKTAIKYLLNANSIAKTLNDPSAYDTITEALEYLYVDLEELKE